MRTADRMRPRPASRLGCLVLLALSGCGGPGTVTITLRAPARTELSPFEDDRRETVTLLDESDGGELGSQASALGDRGTPLPIGNLPVGKHDLRLEIAGSSQLLGLARAPGVDIVEGAPVAVTMNVRKPLAFYGGGTLLGDVGPFPQDPPLLAIDTTLPSTQNPLTDVAPVALSATARITASAATHDGAWLLVAASEGFALIDTGEMALVAVGNYALPDKATGPPVPNEVVFSPDDSHFAVLTDEAVYLADFQALQRKELPNQLPPIPLANATAAEFSPDGATLTVLTGPRWDEVKCEPAMLASLPASELHDVSVANPGAPGPTRMLPASTTDFATHPTLGVLLAVPCGDGVVREDDPSQVVIPGPYIYDVVVSGDRAYAVEGDVHLETIPYDEQDPSMRNVSRPFGRVWVATATDRSSTSFPIPTYAPDISVRETGAKQANFQADTNHAVSAYAVSVTPDGSSLLMADRIDYSVPTTGDANVLARVLSPIANVLERYYLVTAERQLYYLTQIELGRGQTFQVSTGIGEEEACTITGYQCNLFGKNCKHDERLDQSCAFNDGYEPSGPTILMGAN